MAKRIKKENIQLKKLAIELRKKAVKEKSKLWKRIAEELEKPARHRREVNLYKISKTIKEGETALVPGKVLGVGTLDKDVTVAALSFSAAAKEKIKKTMSIQDLLNSKIKKVRIIG